jgi:hypothetical protein
MLLVLSAAGAATLLTASRGQTLVVTAMMILAGAWLLTRIVLLSPRGLEPWAAVLVLVPAVMLPGILRMVRLTPGIASVVATAAAIVVLTLPGGLHAHSGIPQLDALLVQPRLRVPLDANPPAVDSIHRDEREPERALGVDWIMSSGSQALFELEGLHGPDALQQANYEELFKTAGVWRAWGWFTRVPVKDFPRLSPLLDLLNTGFLLALPDAIPQGFVGIPAAGADRLVAGRRPRSWPRAFLVDSVTTYTDAADLLRQVSTSGTPFAAVQQSDRQAMEAASGLPNPPGTIVRATQYRLTVNTTSFVVTSAGPGVAVLSESFVPDDFEARLNGRPVEYFRVNHAFKAVRIPSAGNWQVEFEYRPARWTFSLVLGALGLMVLASLGYLARDRRQA